MKLHRMSISLFAALGLGCDQPEQAAPKDDPAAETLRDSLGNPVGAISRAIILANPQAERHLVARIEVQPNELLEFYEPRPGALLISGAGAPAGKPMFQARESDARTLWLKAARGRPMPASLEAAIVRGQSITPRPRGAADGAPASWGGGSATKPVDLDRWSVSKAPELQRSLATPTTPAVAINAQAGWCDSGYYSEGIGASCPSQSFFTWWVCLDNWWNGAFAQHNDSAFNITNVCPATGPVTLVMFNGDFNINPAFYEVPQNTVRWYQYERSGCKVFWDDCPTIRADVQNAGGDRFHFRFEVEPG
jgi:hypothetical protein